MKHTVVAMLLSSLRSSSVSHLPHSPSIEFPPVVPEVIFLPAVPIPERVRHIYVVVEFLNQPFDRAAGGRSERRGEERRGEERSDDRRSLELRFEGDKVKFRDGRTR